MRSVVRGIGAGLAATAVMTGAQFLGTHYFPASPSDKPMFEHMVDEAAEGTPAETRLDEADRALLGSMAHFSYGAMFGALYGLWRGDRDGDVPSGLAMAAGIWLVSYLGWLPATGVTRLPHEEPSRRMAREALAHVVYGAALGSLYRAR
jgi:hypothetical protein